MNPAVNSPVRAMRLFEPEPGTVYPLEAASHLAHVPRRAILVYCKHGLVSPIIDPTEGGYYFDSDAIRSLQRVEWLHSIHGVNFTGTRIILDLMHEVEQLRATVHSLQGMERPAPWQETRRV